MLVGYLILILGHKSSEIASLMMVNDPLIRAWLAIIAASVAIPTPIKENHPGIISKKGFTSVIARLGCVMLLAPDSLRSELILRIPMIP